MSSWILRALLGTLLTAAAACAPADPQAGDNQGSLGAGKGDSTFRPIAVSDADRARLMVKATTCPFTRAAMKLKALTVGGSVEQPVAPIAEIARLGNQGEGSDLGRVLTFFASINHNKLVGSQGATDQVVPEGTFSLWYPGSAGAHPGHSGILMGDPRAVGSGHFSADRLDRLVEGYSEVNASGSRVITLDGIARFIADNVQNDPDARYVKSPLSYVSSVVGQVIDLWRRGSIASDSYWQDVAHLIVTLDDIGNSSGEFALLFTRFGDDADADGNPTVSADAVVSLFRDGDFPAGWEQRHATALEWSTVTMTILKRAVCSLPHAICPL